MHSGSLAMLIGFAAGAGPSNRTTPDTAAGAEESAEALGPVAAAGAAASERVAFTDARPKSARKAAIINAYFCFIVFLRPPYSLWTMRELSDFQPTKSPWSPFKALTSP